MAAFASLVGNSIVTRPSTPKWCLWFTAASRLQQCAGVPALAPLRVLSSSPSPARCSSDNYRQAFAFIIPPHFLYQPVTRTGRPGRAGPHPRRAAECGSAESRAEYGQHPRRARSWKSKGAQPALVKLAQWVHRVPQRRPSAIRGSLYQGVRRSAVWRPTKVAVINLLSPLCIGVSWQARGGNSTMAPSPPRMRCSSDGGMMTLPSGPKVGSSRRQ